MAFVIYMMRFLGIFPDSRSLNGVSAARVPGKSSLVRLIVEGLHRPRLIDLCHDGFEPKSFFVRVVRFALHGGIAERKLATFGVCCPTVSDKCNQPSNIATRFEWAIFQVPECHARG